MFGKNQKGFTAVELAFAMGLLAALAIALILIAAMGYTLYLVIMHYTATAPVVAFIQTIQVI